MQLGTVAWHHGGGEEADFVALVMNVNAGDVECATDIEPVGRTDDTLVAEAERLATCQHIRPTVRGASDLGIAFPEGPGVLIRIAGRRVVIEEDARILHFTVEAEPRGGLDRCIHAQAVEEIEITHVGAADAAWRFDTITILATQTQPTGQRLVELGDREQPIRTILVRTRIGSGGGPQGCG